MIDLDKLAYDDRSTTIRARCVAAAMAFCKSAATPALRGVLITQERGYPEARATDSYMGVTVLDVTATPERAIVHLIARLGQSGDFPHEIGLFLGYPPCDVRGFIEHRAGGCKCCGCWKVYGDVAEARRCFASYKRCTRIYCGLYDRGVGLDQLAVAV